MVRFLLVIVFFLPLMAQTTWSRTYGGSNEDAGFAVAKTHDGFAITGITNSMGNGDYDLYLIKIDENGDTMWTLTAGGTDFDAGECVIETPDQGILASGLTYSFGAGNSDVFIVKTDSLGNIQWQKTYGGAIADEIYSITPYRDGYMLAGRTYSYGAGNFDVYLIAIDYNGDTLWTRTYGGAITDGANSIKPTADGGFVVTGYTYSYGHGNYDAYVLKLDSLGNLQWQTFLGGSDDDVGTDAVETADGGFLIAGYSYTFSNGADDFYVAKIDSLGNLIWQNHYGGSSSERAFKIEKLPGENFLIGGYTSSFGHGGDDAYFIAINSSGNLVWDTTFGGSNDDGMKDFVKTPAGDFVFAGHTESFGHGGADVYAVRFGTSVGIDEEPVKSPFDFQVTGNLDGHFRVSFSLRPGTPYRLDVFDIAGKRVARIKSSVSGNGITEFRWQASLPSGIYFITLSAPEFKMVRKIAIVRF